MKIKLLLIITLFTTSFYSIKAQCNTTAFGTGNNTNIPSYNVNGAIDVTLNTNQTITLNLGSNFETAQGPDIRAYLVASNGLSDSTLKQTQISALQNIQFGLVGAMGSLSQNGAKTFTVAIPSGVDIINYDRIFFYCLQFNQFWDFAKITPFSNSNCSVLSVNDNSLLNTTNLYPNPTKGNLSINNNNQLNLGVEIYNVLGKKVLQVQNNTTKEQTINLSSLKSGVYLVQLKANGNSITRRLVKE